MLSVVPANWIAKVGAEGQIWVSQVRTRSRFAASPARCCQNARSSEQEGSERRTSSAEGAHKVAPARKHVRLEGSNEVSQVLRATDKKAHLEHLHDRRFWQLFQP